MPLSRGCSSKSIGKNISSLMSGKGHVRPRSQKQAIAIALAHARKMGCKIPLKNPPKNVLKWFGSVYNAGAKAAYVIHEAARLSTKPITSAEINLFYKKALRDFENGHDVIFGVFNKIEKSLFMEGFLHKLMSL